MKPWIRFDERLKRRAEQANTRLPTWQPVHPKAVTARMLVVELLADLPARLTAAVERAQQENHEAYLGSQRVRTAEAAVEDLNEVLYHRRNSALSLLRARDQSGAEALRKEMARTGAEWAPASFRALGIARTITVFEQVLAFSARVLPNDDPDLLAAREALTALRTARDEAEREAGDALEALRALEQLRDDLRADYIAARLFLGGAFTLDRRTDLRRVMAPLTNPSARSNPNADEDDDDTGIDPQPTPPTA